MLLLGLALLLMGVGLMADAKGHAAAALHWLPPEQARRLERAYRAGGAAFIVMGLMVAASGRPLTLDPRLGWAFLACAAWLVLAKRPEWGERSLPPGLAGKSEPEPWGPRLSRWSSWGLAACFAAFGAKLLKS